MLGRAILVVLVSMSPAFAARAAPGGGGVVGPLFFQRDTQLDVTPPRQRDLRRPLVWVGSSGGGRRAPARGRRRGATKPSKQRSA